MAPNGTKESDSNGKLINRFVYYANSVRNLTYEMADAMEQYFKNFLVSSDPKGEKLNNLTNCMREIETQHFQMIKVLHVLRNQEIQRLALCYLPDHIKEEINEKLANPDSKIAQQEIMSTIHKYIPEIEHFVKIGETMQEEYDAFVKTLSNMSDIPSEITHE